LKKYLSTARVKGKAEFWKIHIRILEDSHQLRDLAKQFFCASVLILRNDGIDSDS